MRRMHAFPAFVSIILLVACSAVAAAAADLSALKWMEGHWAGDAKGVRSEEFWSSPAGGGLVGMHKDTREDRMIAFEFLRIVARGDSVFYVASPNGGPSTPFHLIESDSSRVVFANPAHDFPQRIMYRLDAQGRMHAHIEGDVNGVTREMEWVWERQPPR